MTKKFSNIFNEHSALFKDDIFTDYITDQPYDVTPPTAFESLSKEDQSLLREVIREERALKNKTLKEQRLQKKEELRKKLREGKIAQPKSINFRGYHGI
jgi:TRAP-type C4-dicarboxylate transport system substrate-binding protein